MKNIIIDSIKVRRCLKIFYEGHLRIIEPHAYGVTKHGNDVLRAWQVVGGSNSGKSPAWKLFRLDEIRNLELLGEAALLPRYGYKRNDKVMKIIYQQFE